MKNIIKRVAAGCIAGAVALGMPQVSAEASGNVDAGIMAALGDSLASSAQDASLSGADAAQVGQDAAEPKQEKKDSGTEEADAGQGSGEAAQQAEDETICGYTNLGIADVENHLNIRENAGEEYDLVGELPVDAGCEILSEENGWYKIQSGKVTGYVKGEYLLTGKKAAKRAREVKSVVATSLTQTLNARVEPNTDCTIWTVIAEGEELPVIEDMGDWVKVDIDGDECYVAREYVEISEQLAKAMTMTEVRYGEGISDVRVDMTQYACQFVGNRYVWGGTSLTNGVDCSGFTMRIYEKYGVYLPHSSSAQAGCGWAVDSSEAKPGDLFFYGSGGSISHVAMYIGNGQVVHASSAKTGIKVSNAFYRTPICVRRYISD